MKDESKIKESVKDQAIVILRDEITNRKVVGVLLKYEVKYENLCSFVSYSAYMGKSAEMLKLLVSKNLLHIQSLAHKLNPVGNIWSSELVALSKCVKTKMAFINTRKRKQH
ncbi:hypothetical protein PR048_008915 [Dryococelus australis]|uniref:Uncharacterized protein n=1 Tax=Dryococelus australis TaxID=614101 RepID=A0ABQ9HZA1_9NEOP|nr:hypothetical protein PR048_008915 [Dryococelus australis]